MPEADETPGISLYTLAGAHTSDTMQVLVRLGDVTLTALLDSGSTHNFVSKPVAARIGLCFIPCTDIAVTVANGDRVPCAGVFHDASFTINAEEFCADIFVLPLDGYNMVLGIDCVDAEHGQHTRALDRAGRKGPD